jgi:hypothetical protein
MWFIVCQEDNNNPLLIRPVCEKARSTFCLNGMGGNFRQENRAPKRFRAPSWGELTQVHQPEQCLLQRYSLSLGSKTRMPSLNNIQGKALSLMQKPQRMGLILGFQVKGKATPHLFPLFLIFCLLFLTAGATVRASLATKCATAVPA